MKVRLCTKFCAAAAFRLRKKTKKSCCTYDESKAFVLGDGEAALEQRNIVALSFESHVDNLRVDETRLFAFDHR